MTSNAHVITTTEHSPVAGMAHDMRGGISNPILGMILFAGLVAAPQLARVFSGGGSTRSGLPSPP